MMTTKQSTTLTDYVRKFTGGPMNRLGMVLHRAGIHPDAVTIFGLFLTLGGAFLIGLGHLQWGGVVLIMALPLDAVDGAIARAMARRDNFGAMLDSSLDRYADGFIFAALSYHFAIQNQHTWMLCALAALIGSFMVSYTRARAEGVNVDVKVGLFTRLERVIVILLILLFPAAFGLPLLEVGMVVLAVGTNFTGLQRLWYVYRALQKREHGEG